MDSLALANGAAGTIVLGGQTYLLSRARLGDVGALRAFVQELIRKSPSYKAVEETVASAKSLDGDDRKYAIKLCMEEKQRMLSPASDEYRNAMQTIDVAAFMLWRSVAHKAPQVTLETVQAAMNEYELTQIQSLLDAVNGLTGEGQDRPFEETTTMAAT